MITCAQCGRQNPDGSRFCTDPDCYAYLDWEGQAQQTTPTGRPYHGEQPAERQMQPGPQTHAVQVTLAQREVAAQLGTPVTVEVLVRNNGTIVEELTVVVGGPAAVWASVEAPELSLFPGAEATARVTFTAPRAPTTPSGPAPFQISARSQVNFNVAASESGILTVQSYAEPSTQLSPHTASGRFGGKHRLTVQNDGNVPLQGPVEVSDPDELLRFTVRPQVLGIPPGERGVAVIRSKPRKRIWWGTPARRPFKIQVRPVGLPPVESDAALEQIPIVPRGMLPVAGLALAAVLGVSGFFTLKANHHPTASVNTPTAAVTTPRSGGQSSGASSPSASPSSSPSSTASRSSTPVSSAPPFEGGVVVDGSFEDQPSEEFISPWSKRGTGDSRVEQGNGKAHSGENSATLRGHADKEWNDIIQTVDVQPNTNYRLTAWIRTTDNFSDGYFGIRDGTNPSGKHAEVPIEATREYTEFTVDFNSVDNTQMTIFIGKYQWGTETLARIDDVSMKPR